MQKVEQVILVDPDDREIGAAEKLAAHVDGGSLHRAFSVMVFDAEGRMLLQRRAPGKYHSPGLWTNTCCGHPRPGEAIDRAARRRLMEEMGFTCELEPAFAFLYRTDVGGGLTEHEYDHVFVGHYDCDPHPDPQEADAWRWVSPADLRREIAADPHAFTTWFAMFYEDLLANAGSA